LATPFFISREKVKKRTHLEKKEENG